MDKQLIDQAERVMAHTYARFPVVFEKGKGCLLWDTEGRQYIDFVSGIAVCCLGHAHPVVADAIASQAKRLLHVSNLYYTIPQIELATWLTDHSFADRVFFCNSGAEANEAAIKLARKYFSDRGETRRFRMVGMERSFHGRTMGSLSATGQDKIKQGFYPVLEGFDFVPFNDIDALRRKVTHETCAVLLEPLQGEGGVRPPSSGYLEAVRQLCDQTGTLMIFDEIQTGMGRTGKWFAYEHSGIRPDIMTLAKALGNGLPIGAMLATETVASAFTPGSHATTFGGTPLVTAAALAVVREIEQQHVLENCREMGAYFKAGLEALQTRHEAIEMVRGSGLLLGMRLGVKGAPIVRKCMEKGFLINCIQENILRFVPPLIVSRVEIDALITCLDEVLDEYCTKRSP